MDAIILAGGSGSRMEDKYPKPLVRANGKPILFHQLDYLFKFKEIDNIVLSLGNKAGMIQRNVKYYYKPFYETSQIKFSVEEEPLGTAGAVKQALPKTVSDYVLVLNCDDITDINVAELGDMGENSICVAHPRLQFGRVKEKDGYAVFEEKPLLEDWVSCGWYLLNRNELSDLLPEKGSLEYDVFPDMCLRVFKHEGFWKPLNTKKDVVEFESMDLPDSL